MQTYRNFTISHTDPVPPIPQWKDFAYTATHRDYDGPEDGRCFTGKSVNDLKEQINDYHEESLTDALEGTIAALKQLCDGDCAYVGNEIRIQAGSHGDAIKLMRVAREAIAKAQYAMRSAGA